MCVHTRTHTRTHSSQSFLHQMHMNWTDSAVVKAKWGNVKPKNSNNVQHFTTSLSISNVIFKRLCNWVNILKDVWSFQKMARLHKRPQFTGIKIFIKNTKIQNQTIKSWNKWLPFQHCLLISCKLNLSTRGRQTHSSKYLFTEIIVRTEIIQVMFYPYTKL